MFVFFLKGYPKCNETAIMSINIVGSMYTLKVENPISMLKKYRKEPMFNSNFG